MRFATDARLLRCELEFVHVVRLFPIILQVFLAFVLPDFVTLFVTLLCHIFLITLFFRLFTAIFSQFLRLFELLFELYASPAPLLRGGGMLP